MALRIRDRVLIQPADSAGFCRIGRAAAKTTLFRCAQTWNRCVSVSTAFGRDTGFG